MANRVLKLFENVVLEESQISGILDFSNLFGRLSAVHIEIGSGKGTFLVSQAACQPEVDFIGIEWASKYYRYAVDRIGRKNINNIRMLRTDAATWLAEHIATESVDCFHIYFPDPWPKKRHHKRRFISTANVEMLLKLLKPNGIINIATDHNDYFQWMLGVFAGFAEELEKTDFIKPAGAGQNEYAGTNFERKYLKENRTIYTLALRKTRYRKV